MNQDRAEYAAELKNHGGYNCCQAVVAALADETNLPKEQLTQIAAGFCAGMGTTPWKRLAARLLAQGS